MFYIYHILGKKIGVTNNIYRRVTKEQGYSFNEYEILEASSNIFYISNKEIELQKKYGYKVDKQDYITLINKKQKNMYHITEKTITFKNSNINNLLSKIPDVIEINKKLYYITDELKKWIVNNNFKSQINKERYVYLSSFYRKYNNKELSLDFDTPIINTNIYDLIRIWGKEKGIYEKGDSKTQYVKLIEEVGELAKALLKNDKPEIIDAIGDIVVVLTNLAKLENLLIEDCIVSAYDVIKNRKGKMENGTFVKEK
jgi:NTP pyrophosphatase (non-canonical NTP hydrolase)